MGVGAILGSRMVLSYLAQYNNLTLDHLLQCLQNSDDCRRQEVERMLTPSNPPDLQLEPDRTYLRLSYRQQQRDNFLYISEEYGRLHHNALFLKRWLNREWHDIIKYAVDCSPEVRERLLLVREKSIAYCKTMRWIPLKLWAIGLLHHFDRLPNFPLPSIARLRTCRGVDILKSYGELAQAAVDFVSVGYSTEIAEALAQELGLRAECAATVSK